MVRTDHTHHVGQHFTADHHAGIKAGPAHITDYQVSALALRFDDGHAGDRCHRGTALQCIGRDSGQLFRTHHPPSGVHHQQLTAVTTTSQSS